MVDKYVKRVVTGADLLRTKKMKLKWLYYLGLIATFLVVLWLDNCNEVCVLFLTLGARYQLIDFI